MAVTPQFVVDNSAMNRMKYETVRDRLYPLLASRLVATCAIVELEALYSATGGPDYEDLSAQRAAMLTYVETDEEDMQQALEV